MNTDSDERKETQSQANKSETLANLFWLGVGIAVALGMYYGWQLMVGSP
jgi:hypothetical protein